MFSVFTFCIILFYVLSGLALFYSFQHIYTSNGVSLHEWSIYLARFRKRSTKENDELCGICADGGEVLHCATCPRSFHAGNLLTFAFPESHCWKYRVLYSVCSLW